MTWSPATYVAHNPNVLKTIVQFVKWRVNEAKDACILLKHHKLNCRPRCSSACRLCMSNVTYVNVTFGHLGPVLGHPGFLLRDRLLRSENKVE